MANNISRVKLHRGVRAISVWINNHTRCFMRNAVTHPCRNDIECIPPRIRISIGTCGPHGSSVQITSEVPEVYNLLKVVHSEICDDLSCGQCTVYGRADGRTDGQPQATTIPHRPERPRGKNH